MRGGYRPYLLPNRPHLSPLPLSSLLRFSLLNRFTHHTLFILTATHHSFSPKVKVKTPAFHFHIFFYLISLHFTFWRFCWPIVGSEVLQLFGKFHSKDSIVANAKFFVLILKKGGAEDIKDFRSLPDKFVAFSSFLGLPVTGFEKESNSLLWKLESRKGRGVKITRLKKKSPLASRMEREIRKLECSVNYDCSPLSAREGGGVLESVLPLFEVAFPFRSLVVGVGVQMVSRASYVLCYSLGVCFGVGGAFSNGLSR